MPGIAVVAELVLRGPQRIRKLAVSPLADLFLT
jgi:hypothetical protein